MRKLFLLLLAIPIGAIAAPNDDGFIWIDANTRIKAKPVSASSGGSAPEKAPEQVKKAKPKKKADK